ncbi:MAG: mannitol dehydrogenase family protein [Burkholderiaceae bacterium]
MSAPAPRLSRATLASLAGKVRRPAYDIERVNPGIVHLGVGNFHRAHQAVFADDALAAGELDWGVTGVSLRSPAVHEALAPQDGLYTVIERDARAPAGRARVIGALRETMVAPRDPAAVVGRIADPATRIVTLTITEKGYCRGADGASLDTAAPEIAHDLRTPGAPASAVGLLHAAAVRRQRAGARGFTVLSCDNLSGNGALARRLLLEFDAAAGGAPGLAAWIERELAFPDAMVDRIVPHTTDEHRALAASLLGVEDRWPVVTEPFVQWVVRDEFAAGRPRWEASGVQFVGDVAPWEAMKLRLLNAAHSCIAYLGNAAGASTVDAAVAIPALREFVVAFWRDEAAPALPAPVVAQAEPYCERLLERFANPALGHRTRQIAMDGSQKIPLRLLPTLREARRAGRAAPRTEMGLAAWLRHLAGVTDAGERYDVDDPLAAALAHARRGAGDDPLAIAGAVMSLREVFGADLAADAALHARVGAQLRALVEHGAVGALERLGATLAGVRAVRT